MMCVVRKTKWTLAVVTLALASCRGPLQSPTPTPEVVPLYFVTSNSTQSLLYDLSLAYQQSNELIAIVDQTSTGLALRDIAEQPGYALTTYLPSSGDLWAAPLGRDGIAVITHPGIILDSLTAADLRAIFMGTVDNWSIFGTSDLTIIPVSREESAPTRLAFDEQVLGLRPVTLRARLATTAHSMIEIIAHTPGAIGYVSMTLLNDRVRVVPLRSTPAEPAVVPSPQAIASNTYPLQMPLLIVGQQAPVPGDGYYEFILWAQQGSGQNIIARRYAPLP